MSLVQEDPTFPPGVQLDFKIPQGIKHLQLTLNCEDDEIGQYRYNIGFGFCV